MQFTTATEPCLCLCNPNPNPDSGVVKKLAVITSLKLLNQTANKCIRDDTKAAACQNLNCIKNKEIKYAKNDFKYGRCNSYTLQYVTIMTLISPGDCILQCGMWLWNRDSEFTKWQHPTM